MEDEEIWRNLVIWRYEKLRLVSLFGALSLFKNPQILLIPPVPYTDAKERVKGKVSKKVSATQIKKSSLEKPPLRQSALCICTSAQKNGEEKTPHAYLDMTLRGEDMEDGMVRVKSSEVVSNNKNGLWAKPHESYFVDLLWNELCTIHKIFRYKYCKGEEPHIS